jgi:CspA family cold shock protein
MEKRETGIVKRYDKIKGYGFIEPDYGKDIFVHQSGLLEARWLKEGDRVEYKVIQGEKGLQAVDVIVVEE